MPSVRVQVGPYSLQLWLGEGPSHLADLLHAAELAEVHGDPDGQGDDAGELFVLSVSRDGAGALASALTLAQRYSPSGPGFEPGVLLLPDTNRLFVGAGERLLAYDLAASAPTGPARLWEDRADVGFWWWDRVDTPESGGVVLMAAELGLAAWDARGRPLWRTFAEPPWSYRVDGDGLILDVMGHESRFSILTGPS